jgi:hypothetical protein
MKTLSFIPAPRPTLIFLGALAVLTGAGLATETVFDTLAHAPGPRPTAEQVLDGSIPGRPNVPPSEEIHDRTGFDSSRLYTVPPPGQHPRILFSAKDLPRIRQQLEANETGRRLKADLLWRAEAHRTEPNGWLAQAYDTLVGGDLRAFELLWADPRNPHKNGPPGSTYSPLSALLFYRGFSALLLDDQERGRENAAAVASYARWLRPQVEEAAKKPGAENYWLQIRGVVGDFGSLAFLYDFSQPHMTPEQAGAVRDLIALCLKDRYGLAMDLPAHWRDWNFVGMGLYFPLLALALEGEPGFDPRVVARAREVARDYFRHGNSDLGGGKEGLGYHSGGMGHAAVLGLALANRGDNLLTLDRHRRMFDTWMVWTMQPYGREWASEGDLGTFPPSPPGLQLARFLFPSDERIALVAGQAPAVTQLDKRVPEQGLLQLLAPVDLGPVAARDEAPAFPEEMPLSAFDRERGVVYARSDRTPEALSLQFHARNDTTYPSHDHADRGAFILSALGRPWAVPSMRETASQYNSIITIDGVGQGYFPTPARWIDVTETPSGVTATVDTSYCYDWRWMKSSFLATDDQLAREPWLEVFRESRDRLLSRTPREKWERDPSPNVRAYYEPWLAGDPRMWGAEDAWVLRTPYNPVRKAFRSIAMVRGESPFVVMADDIRKDDLERLYEWRMILPMDVEAHDIKGGDIILGPVAAEHTKPSKGSPGYKNIGKPVAPPGTPMLLVRVLEIATPAMTETTPVPEVETIEFMKHDDTHQYAGRSLGLGRRLVLPSRSVEPRYRVLLFPFRQGETLPETRWESPDVLAVSANEVTRRVRFTPAEDGSTRLSILP